jgi:hypothetical protein
LRSTWRRPKTSTDVLITASEVHDYFYCPYAWWYENVQVDAGQAAMLETGTEYHRSLTARLPTPQTRRLSWLLVLAAAVLVLTALVLLLLG